MIRPFSFRAALMGVLTILCHLILTVGNAADADKKLSYTAEQVFQYLDTDSNGKLTLEEFSQMKATAPYYQEHPEALRRAFDRFASQPGSLSLADFRKYYAAAMALQPRANRNAPATPSDAPPAAPQPSTSKGNPERAFHYLDTNGDGRLTLQEFEKLRSVSAYFRENPDMIEPIFHQLDMNGDGQLTFEEYKHLYTLREEAERAANAEAIPPKPSKAAKETTPPSISKADMPVAVATPDQIAFFEKNIRPVLADKCYKCHAADSEKIRGGLTLDTREGIRRGGDTGPAVVPGDISQSLLMEALRYSNRDMQMPPAKQGGKLPDEVIAHFEEWIRMGAPDPRDKQLVATPAASPSWYAEKAKDHWAFKAPQREAPPQVQNTNWPHSDLDKFVLAQIETKKLHPVADADASTLVRRIYFDLTGLPPSPQDVAAFAQSAAKNKSAAIEELTDRLLKSPSFGERWGRHWLDVARYAESTGRDSNCLLPHAWRYRDYVISAFNEDKPYDEFIREQIAGDLLPAKDNHERAEHLVATGFLTLGSRNLSERNPKQFALDMADEQIDTVTQSIMGMTVACARCHDHKFDPISQRDYYAMAGIFLSTECLYGTAPTLQNLHPSSLIELPTDCGLPRLATKLTSAQRAEKEADITATQKRRQATLGNTIIGRGSPATATGRDLKTTLFALATSGRIGQLQADLDAYDAEGNAKLLAMGVQDLPSANAASTYRAAKKPMDIYTYLSRRATEFSAIHDSPFFARGDVDKEGDPVPRGVINVLSDAPAPSFTATESGRRELAEWLASPKNKETARVFVNRVWYWLTGRGIVESTDNFGVMGQAPSNLALLDYLALRFEDSGWKIKSLIRDIVLSRTYQLASTYDVQNFETDPEDTLNWRMAPRRMEAESIRDAMLCVSGALQSSPVGSPIALIGNATIGAGQNLPGLRAALDDDQFLGAAGNTRSVYLPIVRNAVPDALGVFDFGEPDLVAGRREVTTAPSQALYLLNNTFVEDQAQRFAKRLMASPAEQRINLAFAWAFARQPSASETSAAQHFFQSRRSSNADELSAWRSFCQALFGTAEFRILN